MYLHWSLQEQFKYKFHKKYRRKRISERNKRTRSAGVTDSCVSDFRRSEYGSGFDISGRLVCPVQPGENTQGKNKGCTQGSQKQDKLVAAAVQKINGLRWGLLCFDPDISQQKDCKQQVKKKTEIKEDHAGYGTGTPDMIKNLKVKEDEVDVQDDQKI